MSAWTIRRLETPHEIEQAEQLQSLVWPGSDLDVIPAHVLITAAHNGGLVLGAYTGEKLIGMLFGFVGLYALPAGTLPKHCSHELGIHPDYRNLGIGFALKRAQLDIVRAQGLDLITWTYDPLLSLNAHLNIARLGAICQTYLREAYGEMRDGLNVGLPSDRFQVDWWINSERVQQRISPEAARNASAPAYQRERIPLLYETSPGPSAALISPPGHFTLRAEPVLLAEIPSDFPTLKHTDHGLARAWRDFSRKAFEDCFQAGYHVLDFIHDDLDRPRRSFYVLAHR